MFLHACSATDLHQSNTRGRAKGWLEKACGSSLIGLVTASLFACFTANANAGDNTFATIKAHEEAHRGEVLADLRAFLSIPNIAGSKTEDARTRYADLTANADWIMAHYSKLGFSTQLWQAGGAPYVFAERSFKGAEKTLLFYAHFDGQPVDESRWSSPPFTPTLRDGTVEALAFDLDWPADNKFDENWRVFARSAGDDKVSIIALAAAIQALDANDIAQKVNIKILFDGEEESGSPSIADIAKQNKDALRADLMLFLDGPMHQSGGMQLIYGARGTMSVDLTAYGANRPLHSGHYGNWAPNPTDTIVELLASMKNSRGETVVQGFDYEAKPLTDAEKDAINAMPHIDEALRRDLNLPHTDQLADRIELQVTRPALVVRGIDGGPVGAKGRNVIGTKTTASLNIRMVPGQTVEFMRKVIERHIFSRGYKPVPKEPSAETLRQEPNLIYVDWRGTGYPAYRTDLRNVEAERISTLIQRATGTAPIKTPTMGGSLPLSVVYDELKTPILILPVANHDNNQHGPNENIRIGNISNAVSLLGTVIADY